MHVLSTGSERFSSLTMVRRTIEAFDLYLSMAFGLQKKLMLTFSIDSTMQIDEKMIVAKLIQTKLFKTIRTMKKDRQKKAVLRAARQVVAAHRANASAAALKARESIPPIVAHGKNCLV